MLAIYRHLFQQLSAIWSDPNYSHGFLIPPVALYLAWSQRAKVLAAPRRPDTRGLAAVLLGCAMFLAGSRGASFFLACISFVVLLAGLIWTLWGLPRLRALAFPVGLLLTAVPSPEPLYSAVATSLQSFASTAATELIRWFGGIAYQEGNIIRLPGISIGIAEACSGLRSLYALGVFAVLLGYFERYTACGRILLVLLAIPLAVAMNVVRVAGTAALATGDKSLAMGFHHTFSGGLIFLASAGIMLAGAKAARAALRRPHATASAAVS